MARLSESGKTEVDRAVDDVASRWKGVSQNVGRAAFAVNISAVGLGDTRCGRSALSGDLVEDVLDGGDRAGRSRLEVLLDLGGVGGSGRSSSASEGGTVGESVDRRCLLAATAVGLHSRSLHEVTADPRGLGAINVGGDSIASVLNRAGDLRGVDSSGGESTN